MESKDLFDSVGLQHQYDDLVSSEEDPFARTRQEALIDNDGFPLIPGTSPAHSPVKKKAVRAAPQGGQEDEEVTNKSKFHDSIDRYIIPCRKDIKPAREVGITLGIPYVGVIVGSKPIRTHTTRHADSAQHVQYSKILTAADPPGTAPYSWVQIGADRRNEIKRVKEVRQTPQYKLQKRNAQIYNKVYGMRASMKHLPPRRFWDEWTSTVSEELKCVQLCCICVQAFHRYYCVAAAGQPKVPRWNRPGRRMRERAGTDPERRCRTEGSQQNAGKTTRNGSEVRIH
jgi:hypothetical protein